MNMCMIIDHDQMDGKIKINIKILNVIVARKKSASTEKSISDAAESASVSIIPLVLPVAALRDALLL